MTKASPEAVEREDAAVDASALDRALGAARTLDLRALTPADLVAPYLFTAHVPAGAVLIDCRAEQTYDEWHYPGAERRDEWEVLRDFARFPKDRTYVLYCAHGVQSAYLAERMQRAGYDAYSFRGGARALRALTPT